MADVVVNFDVRSQKQIPVTVEAEMLLDGISLGVKRVATESSKKVAVLEGYRMDCFERDNRCFLVQPPKQERRLSARATLTFGDPAVVVRGTFEDGFVNCVKGTAVADARIKLPPKIDCPGSGKIIGSVTYIVFPEDQEKVKELEIRIEADNIIDGRKTVAIEFIPAHKLKMDGKFHEESIEAEAKCFDFKDASGKPFCSLRVKDVSLQVDASDFLTIGTLMGKGGPNDKIGQSFSEKKRTRCQPKRGDGGSGGAGGSGGSGGSGGPDGGGGSGGGSGGGGSGGGGSGGGSGGSDAGGVESGGSGGSNGGGGSGGGSGAGGGGGGGGGGASGGGGQDFARVVG